jgi:LppX_LprAFG lipoprotein
VGEGVKPVGIEDESSYRRPGRRGLGAGLAVIVIAVVAILVAQGGGGSGGPLNAIAKAAEVTQRQPGGRALIHATVTSASSPDAITESGWTIFDDSGRARGTVVGRNHSTGKEAKVTTIADGSTVYFSSEEFGSLPGGKKWMELDLSSAADEGSSASTSSGPTEGLKILETVEGAEEVGKEEIDGTPTTHYKGTLPVAKKAFGVKLHPSTRVVDVWIDAQGRVRRMRLVVSGTAGESGEASTTDMTIDYVEFGRVPQIAVPLPNEVFNATRKVESMIQAEGGGH